MNALLSLRQVFNTEMDNLRDKYGIEPGPAPEDVNAYIGKEIGEIYVVPPPKFRKPDDEQRPDQTAQ